MPTPEGELLGAIALPLNAPARHLLLWFGGRNEDVRWTPALAGWLGSEFAVASFAYRGHLGSAGRASEQQVVADGRHMLNVLHDMPELAEADFILAGRSLGASVVLQVAAQLPDATSPAALVLLSPIDSVRSLARAHPLLTASVWALRSPFDSMAVAASAARCPVLMLLAETDRRVPHARSRRLAAALSQRAPVSVRTVAGTDHRSLPRASDALESIATFARQVVAAPARPRAARLAGSSN